MPYSNTEIATNQFIKQIYEIEIMTDGFKSHE